MAVVSASVRALLLLLAWHGTFVGAVDLLAGNIAQQGQYWKVIPPPDAPKGINQGYPPLGACRADSVLAGTAQCPAGFSCSQAPSQPDSFCNLQADTYPASCEGLQALKLGDQCGGPSPSHPTADGSLGSWADACCPLGLTCAANATAAWPSTTWFCTIPPLPLPPSLEASQEAAPVLLFNPTLQDTPSSPPASPPPTPSPPRSPSPPPRSPAHPKSPKHPKSPQRAKSPNLAKSPKRPKSPSPKRPKSPSPRRPKSPRTTTKFLRYTSSTRPRSPPKPTPPFQSRRPPPPHLHGRRLTQNNAPITLPPLNQGWPLPTDSDFVGPPTTATCFNATRLTSFCNCWDAVPECYCSPFKTGYELVPPPIKIQGAGFVDSGGNTVRLKGMNWFGFENTQKFPDGSWIGNSWSGVKGDFRSCLATDASLQIWRMRLLGFNAIRLPFTFDELDKPATTFQEYGCRMPTLEEFKAWNLPPEFSKAPSLITLGNSSRFRLTDTYRGWKCMQPGSEPYLTRGNFYTPGSYGRDVDGRKIVTTMQRYLWFIQYFVSQGFYVMVDYHPQFASDAPYELDASGQYVFRDTAAFRAAWASFMTALTALPTWSTQLKDRVLVDVVNEMDLLQCLWNSQGASRTGLTQGCPPYGQLVSDGIRGITSVYPQQIVLVQGAGQTELSCMTWGDGFRVDAGAKGSSASAWFASLDPSWQVVLSPHLYCSFTWYCTPDQLAERYDLNWGHKTQGYAGRQFPVVVGETGVGWDPYAGDQPWVIDVARKNLDFDVRTREQTCHAMTVKYFTNREWTYRTGDVTTHELPAGIFFWTWNFHSGLVGGMTWHAMSGDLARQGVQIKWFKIKAMEQMIGLVPWYRKPGAFVGANG